MRKIIFLWVLICISISGIAQTPLQTIKQDLQKVMDRVDVLIKAEEPKPEEPKLDSCKRGPTPERIFNVTQSGANVVFDGDGVFGWEYSIYQGTIKKAGGNSGDKNLESNTVPISFSLEPGDYTLKLTGKTCKSKVYSKPFTVPKPTGDNGNTGGNSDPPPVSDKSVKFQLILGTTGSGFQSDARYGLDESWVERIEAFKYSWGYGITGICVWIPWDSYEKTPGVYEEAAFKRIISFCRDRKLTLSVAFMGRRHEGDGFIRTDEIIKGSNGTPYVEGVPGYGSIYAGYSNDRVNALMSGAIKSISKLLKTYENSFYIAMAGGGAGEQVNHVFQNNGLWELSDFSQDNLNRFKDWAAKRGVSGNAPPIIAGPGIDWPHPDYNNPVGLEFGRFTTYGIYKYYKNFVDAVKSVSDLKCIYFYSVTSNRQFRAIQNPNLNFIASPGDGMYGSDGDGLDDLNAKVKVNSVNLGTFPNGISATEVDPDDISPARNNYRRMPQYCEGNLNYNAFQELARKLYSRGLQVLHLAMAFCPQEAQGFEPYLKTLHQEYIGKPYVRPVINASNTVTVEVTDKYRKSQDLMEGIDPYVKYTKYTDCNFWGAIKPEGATNCDVSGPSPAKDYSPVQSYIESNLANAYNWNVVFDLRSPSAQLYSFEKGGKTKDTRFKVMSHSKFVTGVIISYLIDQGKLSLDTKVGDVIGSWNKPDRAGITLRQIMGHTSGIPDNQSQEGMDRLDQYVDWLAGIPISFTPGTNFSYSSVSYQVAARMAEVVTGKAWKDLFREILADPCEMGDAEFNPSEGPIPGKPLNPLAGYGLQCSVNQWMNFIGMIRDGGVFNGRRVLNERVFDILKTQTSPGWSDWGVGVMIKDGQYVSEAASGCGTFILPGKYACAIFTASDYSATDCQNREVREMVKQIYEQ